MSGEPAVLLSTTDHARAELLKNLLLSAGIAAEIITSRTTHWGIDVIQAVGRVDVVVPAEDEADARALLEALERGELSLDEDAPPPE
jgi:hypothetical protein